MSVTDNSKTILLVEDESIIAMAEAAVLSRQGYAVRKVRTGEQAVEVAADGRVDLVLMDIDLGRGIDGTEAARRILSMRDLPIVFMTSHSEREYVERVKEITRYGYVLKDAGEFVMSEAITMAFELFEAHKRSRRDREELAKSNGRLMDVIDKLATQNARLTKTEAALRTSRQSYKSLFDNLPSGYAVFEMEWNAHGRGVDYTVVSVNTAFERLTGRNGGTFVGESMRSSFSSLSNEWFVRVGEVCRTGVSQRMSLYVPELKRSFQLFVFHVHGDQLAVVIENMTHGRIDPELSGSMENTELSLFVEAHHECAYLIDCHGYICAVNSALERMVGHTRDELIGQHVSILAIDPRVDAINDRITRTIEKGSLHFESLYCHSSGRAIVADTVSTHVAVKDGAIVVTSRDMSSERSSQRFLENERARLQAILDATRVGSWEWHIPSGANRYDGRWKEILGYDTAMLSSPTQKTWDALLHPEDRIRSYALVEAHFHGETGWYECEVRLRNAQDEWVWVLDRGKVAERDEKGQPVRMFGTIEDISDRKRLEVIQQRELQVRDVLVNELRFRIKKSISLVLAMLALKDEELGERADLSDLRSRVHVIQGLHERLLSVGELYSVSLPEYARAFLGEIVTLYSQSLLALRVDMDSYDVPTELAIPLGLVIGEIVTGVARARSRTSDHVTLVLEGRYHSSERCYHIVITCSDPESRSASAAMIPLDRGYIDELMAQIGGELSIRSSPPSYTVCLPGEGNEQGCPPPERYAIPLREEG